MFIDSGQGQPLVFLPGFGGTGQTFRAQIEAFSPDYRVLAWTMPGYGDAPAMDLVTIGALTLALCAELNEREIHSAHFVGHAIGGMIVQELAARNPERILSATLFATQPSLGGEAGQFRRQFMAQRLSPIDAGLSMVDIAPALMTTLVSPYADPAGVRTAIDELAAVPAATYRRVIEAAGQFDRRDDLGKLAMPVLCLTGEADRQAPAMMMERMADKMKQGQFALIRRAGHEAHLEQPRTFNALLGAFLADVKAIAA